MPFEHSKLRFLQRLGHGHSVAIGSVAMTHGFISPGAVVIFEQLNHPKRRYEITDRTVVAVVVANNRTGPSDGMFVSGKGNTLLSCFKIHQLDPTTAAALLLAMAQARHLANYHILKIGLSTVFGSHTFSVDAGPAGDYRTYNLGYMKNTNTVQLDINTLRTIIEMEDSP